MKVAWVQDISRPHGGAECSNRTVVAAGERRGHDIVGVTPFNFYPWVLREADVLIVNNFFEFPPKMFEQITEHIWQKGKRYIVYSHDHRDAFRRTEFARKLFGKSALNVFISPRHRDAYRRMVGCDGIALPLAIDTELFRPVEGVRREENLAVIVGGWVRGGKMSKSLVRFMAENGKYRYLSVGLPLAGAEVIPKRPLEKMPEVYSRAQAFVHFPDIECAGERGVFESALCGVKEFHLGEKVGHASWRFDLTDREELAGILKDAVIRFWEEVERG